MVNIQEVEQLIKYFKNGFIVLKIKDEEITELDFKQKLKEKDIKKLLKNKDNSDTLE